MCLGLTRARERLLLQETARCQLPQPHRTASWFNCYLLASRVIDQSATQPLTYYRSPSWSGRMVSGNRTFWMRSFSSRMQLHLACHKPSIFVVVWMGCVTAQLPRMAGKSWLTPSLSERPLRCQDAAQSSIGSTFTKTLLKILKISLLIGKLLINLSFALTHKVIIGSKMRK
jgi:hypothetical protein